MIVEPHQLARVLRSARERLGWSQEHLARKAGLSLRTVVRAEGGADVSGPTMVHLCQALGVKVRVVELDAAAPAVAEDDVSMVS